MSPKEYAAYLRKQAKELPERVVMPAFRRRAFKVLELAVQNTPVNTGRLRNGWHLTIGGPSGVDSSAVAFGPVSEEGGFGGGAASAAGVLQAGQRVINQVRFGETVWIQNNVPYARVIEDGLYKFDTPPGGSKATHVPKSRRNRVAGTKLVEGGFHVSAPRGMLADAHQQVQTLIQAGAL